MSLDEAEANPASADGPEHVAINRELAARLADAMAQLPDEQREAVVLHLQSKLRFREIAGLQGVSINTALSRYRYALDRLRSTLDGELRP